MTSLHPRPTAPAAATGAVLRRPPRTPPPPVPGGERRLPAPPQTPPPQTGAVSWLQYAFPAVGSLGALLFVLMNPRPLFIAGSVLFALSSVAMGIGLYVQQRGAQRRGLLEQRRRHHQELDSLRREAAGTAAQQRRAAAWTHPAADRLWTLACSRDRVWERRRGDPDFLVAALGRGRRPLATPLRLEGTGPGADPLSLAEAQRLVAGHGEVEDLPLTLDLGRGGLVEVDGGDEARALARAVVAELVTVHAPDDLVLAVCVGPATSERWEWVKWLPHLRHPHLTDSTGPLRLLSGDADELVGLLEGELGGRRQSARGSGGVRPPHLLIVVDRGAVPEVLAATAELPAVTVLAVAAEGRPGGGRLRVRVGDGRLEVPGEPTGRAAGTSVAVCTALARRLAPLRLSAAEQSAVTAAGIDLPGLLGTGDPAGFDPVATWRSRPAAELLRLPVGLDQEGAPLVLDLKEQAQGGMGPHGLVVGATGAGKSELLRTLVTGLAMTHPPDLLGLVLVDFKGGATFAELADLPHVAGMITNLGADLALVDRVRDALHGEQNRRQELLRRAGNLAGIREYRAAAATRPELEPMPYLLVVVDEFGQLLGARPDFLELFVSVGRLGRSLGMHLLLASQQLDEGRLRGLEGHVSYRICLRTFTAAESRAVLGVPDAYELPPLPGSAYLKVDTSVLRRFRAALVSAPLRRHAEAPRARTAALLPFTAAPVMVAPPPWENGPGDAAPPAPGGETVMGAVVARLRDAAPPVHQVWLPPLEPVVPLDAVLPGVALRGPIAARTWPAGAGMSVPLGLLDRPLEQRREVLAVDLAADGHLAVVGAPQTGKSTLLRTLVLGLALTRSPREVWVHALDFGGGGLAQLGGLPHVGTVCGRPDPERVRRVVAHVAGLLEGREQAFRAGGIDSPATLRAVRAGGALPTEIGADVVLVVDGWAAFRQEHEDLEPLLADIAARGPGYAVHLVVSAGRWVDLRANLRDSIGGRLELRLNDATESMIDRHASAALPGGLPGRGLAAGGLLVQVALPRIDGVPRRDDLGAATDAAVTTVAGLWPGEGHAAPVRVLPALLTTEMLPAPGDDPEPGVPVGVAEPALAPVYLDLLGDEPHLAVYGDGGSGKTSLLRTYLAGLCARHGPDRVSVVLVDARMRLREVVPRSHLLADAPTAAAARDAVLRLRELAEGRLPSADLDPAALRDRSWWTGPDVLAVVDDYDLISTPSNNPLLPLVEVLAQGRDLGIHLIVARRTGGAARALFEPPLQRLRELGAPGIILSGERQEGALIGPYSAAPRPPGRGMYVRRGRRPALVQIALLPEDAAGDR